MVSDTHQVRVPNRRTMSKRKVNIFIYMTDKSDCQSYEKASQLVLFSIFIVVIYHLCVFEHTTQGY